ESEKRADDELAQRVAGRDHRPRPAEFADHEVVVQRQPVQREADDGEERCEGGRGHLRVARAGGRGAHEVTLSRRAERGGSVSERLSSWGGAAPVQKSVTSLTPGLT